MQINTTRRAIFAAPLAIAASATVSSAATKVGGMPPLFKVVTVKDEIVIALGEDDVAALGGEGVGAIGRAIATQGELTVWRYAVRKAADGELELAPLHRVSILGHESMRVEPYATPLRIVPIA